MNITQSNINTPELGTFLSVVPKLQTVKIQQAQWRSRKKIQIQYNLKNTDTNKQETP